MEKRLICSNVHYFYYDTDFFFQKAAEAGFQYIEFYLGTPHIFIDGNVIDDFSHAAESAKRCGCKITAVHPETISFRYGLCYSDKEWNDRSVRAYKHCIDFASQLEIPQLNTNVIGAFRDEDRIGTMQRLIHNLQDICEYAKDKKVQIALEPEADYFEGFLTDLEDMKTVVEAVGDDHIKVNLNYDALQYAGESVTEWFEAYGDRCDMIRFSSLEDFEKAHQTYGPEGLPMNICFFLADDKYLDKPYEEDARIAGEVLKRWRDMSWV